MTDPLDDTKFWTVQEYAGANRNDFLNPSYAGPWETWWAQVDPAAPAPSRTGNLMISEFRLRGPQGVRDEFVDLYNPNSSALIVNTTDNSEGWALASNDGTTTTLFAVIPNGTVIPAFGHFLAADNPDNTAGGTSQLVYSLGGVINNTTLISAAYPANQVRGADSDTGWSLDISDTSGIAIFNTATVANFSAATIMDAVGPATLPGGSLFRQGTGLGPLPTSNLQYTLFRNLQSGNPQSTGDNASDFRFGDVADTNQAGLGQALAAPGPENLSSTIRETLPASLVDAGCNTLVVNPGSTTACSREYNSTPVTNGSLGTLWLRQRFTNNTGGPITRLRFRVTNISGPPGPPDLRALSSSTVLASLTGGGSTTIQGLTLEQPANQALGGGLDSSLFAPTITLNAPLNNGATINVHFAFGVNSLPAGGVAGLANVAVGVDGRPIPLGPTAATVSLAGRVLNSSGSGVRGAMVTLTDMRGIQRTALTNAFGYYTFDNVPSGMSYMMRASARRFTFGTKLLSVTDSLADVDFVDGQ